MPRKKGVVGQSTLDWYAARAHSAQQWFSSAVASYWAFSLQNNSNGGSTLWVYDVAQSSGLVLPPGVGNPSGNPNAQAGVTPAVGSPTVFQFISDQRNAAGNATQISVTNPAGIVKGNVLLLVLIAHNKPAANISVDGGDYTRIGGVDGSANAPGIATFFKIATASEPATFTVSVSGGATDFGYHTMQFSGAANPGASDVAAGLLSAGNTTSPTAPAVTTTAKGDLVHYILANHLGPGSLSGAPGMTNFSQFVSSNLKWIDGYATGVNEGVNGPYIGSDSQAESFAGLTTTLKAALVTNAPGQTLANPIADTSPLASGILTMQFSTSPIGLSGVTKWLPPYSSYSWSREAPIAIIRPSQAFNVAGIAPEYAAWCDMTWLAIR